MGDTNPANFANPVPINQGGFNSTTKNGCFNNVSPCTTKGDLIVHNGANNVRHAVGTNGHFVTADSAQSDGIKTAAGAACSSVGLTSSQLTISGSPVTGSSAMTVSLPASLPGRNYLINAEFSIWQFGTSRTFATAVPIASATITADGWCYAANVIGSSTVISQVARGTQGQYYLRWQRTAGQGGATIRYISQSLTRSQCLGAAGSVFTLSFKALRGANYSSASNALTVTVYSGTGTTDINGTAASFTGSVAEISQTATLTTSEQTFSYTTGTLGSTVTQLCVQFSMTPSGTAGAADWWEATEIKLERSPQATPFEYKSGAQNLKECMYWIQKSFLYTVVPAQAVGLGNGEYYMGTISTGATAFTGLTMPLSRTRYDNNITAFTRYNPVSANAFIRNITQSADCSVTSGAIQRSGWVTFTGTGNAAGTLADRSAINYAVDWSL